MLSRPTTEQILLDCCRELMTGVLPVVTDETAQVKLIMVDTVLRNMAVRSAHEIAWMREEIAAIESYVQAVLDADATAVDDARGADQTRQGTARRPEPQRRRRVLLPRG